MAITRRSHAAYADLFGHISAVDAHAEPEADQLFVGGGKIKLQTAVVLEGYTFQVELTDTPLSEAVTLLRRRGARPAQQETPMEHRADLRPSERTLTHLWDRIDQARQVGGEHAAAALAAQALDAISAPVVRTQRHPSDRAYAAIGDRIAQARRQHGEQAAIAVAAKALALITDTVAPAPRPKPAPVERRRRPAPAPKPVYDLMWSDFDDAEPTDQGARVIQLAQALRADHPTWSAALAVAAHTYKENLR
jgi:hypothetical protein